MSRMVRRTLLMMGVTWLTTSCALYHHYGQHYGMVVDAATKEPIEGAAVVAVYSTELYTPAGAIGKYLDTQETVTDKNGEFKIPPLNSFVFRPLQSFEWYPHFTIFKPNYGCYPGSYPLNKGIRQWPTSLPKGYLPSNEYVTIELSNIANEPLKIKIRNSSCDPEPGVPRDKYPMLYSLMQEERKALELEPIKKSSSETP